MCIRDRVGTAPFSYTVCSVWGFFLFKRIALTSNRCYIFLTNGSCAQKASNCLFGPNLELIWPEFKKKIQFGYNLLLIHIDRPKLCSKKWKLEHSRPNWNFGYQPFPIFPNTTVKWSPGLKTPVSSCLSKERWSRWAFLKCWRRKSSSGAPGMNVWIRMPLSV